MKHEPINPPSSLIVPRVHRPICSCEACEAHRATELRKDLYAVGLALKLGSAGLVAILLFHWLFA